MARRLRCEQAVRSGARHRRRAPRAPGSTIINFFFIFTTIISSGIAYNIIFVTIAITISPGGNNGPWVGGGCGGGGLGTLGTRELRGGGTRGQPRMSLATTAAAALSWPYATFRARCRGTIAGSKMRGERRRPRLQEPCRTLALAKAGGASGR